MSHVVCNDNSFPSPKVTLTVFFSISFLLFFFFWWWCYFIEILHFLYLYFFIFFFLALWFRCRMPCSLVTPNPPRAVTSCPACDGGHSEAHCVGNGSSRPWGGWVGGMIEEDGGKQDYVWRLRKKRTWIGGHVGVAEPLAAWTLFLTGFFRLLTGFLISAF